MTLINTGPVYDMMREEAAKQKAREDHAYAKERRRLEDLDATEIEIPSPYARPMPLKR